MPVADYPRAVDVDVPPFTAADITARVDRVGRLVLLVDDEVAAALDRAGYRSRIDAGLEVETVVHGAYPVGTRVHAAARVLLEFVAERLPVHLELPTEVRHEAVCGAQAGSLYAIVVGQRSWDGHTRMWTDDLDRFAPHDMAWSCLSEADGAVHWIGNPSPDQ